MADMADLWYHIDGKRNISSVVVSPNETILQLKRKIHTDSNKTFTEYDAQDLILTKADVDFVGIANDIYAGKYQFQTDDQPLWDMQRISDVWPQSLADGQIHVHVSVDTTGLPDGPPLKRRRSGDDPESPFLEEMAFEEIQQFWKDLWQKRKDPFREVSVRRDPNPVGGVDVPETMEVLRLPDTFSSPGDIMVRDDYAEALKALEGHSTSTTRGVVIVGHPGIGKTTLLYYILVKRLLEQQPTILQISPQYLFIFSASGVKSIAPSKFAHPKSEEYQRAWALVDINPDVQKPAEMLRRASSPFFLVMASSPRASRWQEVQRYRGPVAFWLMNPFSLAELIQARQLQEVNYNESDIKNFFLKYGPSARDCYNSCSADALGEYDSTVRRKVNQMHWDSLTELLTRQSRDIQMDQGSHMVLLVQPHPDNRAVSRTTIVTNTVSQLLWERDSDEKWRNHHKLFKTLLREPSAQGFCGSLFEPAFHALCVRGAEFDLYPMTRQRGGPVNIKFKDNRPGSRDGSTTLKLDDGQVRVFFGKEYPITRLLAKHYYQPITSNYPSYDSFVYDPVSRQISAFQATVADKHDLASTGVKALRDLGRQLGINGLKIRVIVVGFGDNQIIYTVEKELLNSLRLEVYAVWLTENQLYPHS